VTTPAPDASAPTTGSDEPKGTAGEAAEPTANDSDSDGGTDSASSEDSGCSAAGGPSRHAVLPLLLALAWLATRRSRR
jgi:hypothetical protein